MQKKKIEKVRLGEFSNILTNCLILAIFYIANVYVKSQSFYI